MTPETMLGKKPNALHVGTLVAARIMVCFRESAGCIALVVEIFFLFLSCSHDALVTYDAVALLSRVLGMFTLLRRYRR